MLLLRIFLLIVLISSFSNCWVGRPARERDTQEWIQLAIRPIKVTQHNPRDNFASVQGNHYYTLIDKNGNVYLANGVRFVLPTVIE